MSVLTPRTDKYSNDNFYVSAIGPYERGFNDGMRKAATFSRTLETELDGARGILQLMRYAARQKGKTI
jgi:hypothetical protein